jgi:16S rRNA processing protein RimM
LIVGRVARPHGVRGEVLMQVLTDYPDRLAQIETLYLGDDHRPHRVERMRRHSKGMIVLFDGLHDRDMAEALRRLVVYVHVRDAVPLEDGEYYLFQLKDIRVVTDEGQELGRLVDVLETGANDVYIVATAEGGELLLPAIPDVIRQVDIPAGVMTVHLLDGLL